MRLFPLLSTLLVCILPLSAQSVLFPGTATASPGNTVDNVSWGNYTPPGATGFRLQIAYEGSNFAARNLGSTRHTFASPPAAGAMPR